MNSAVRRRATSWAPSSTTTAPITARLTYSSSSTGATALSAAMNEDRIAGIWEVIVMVTGFCGVLTASPEKARPLRPTLSPSAWLAVSRPSAAGYHQAAFMNGLRLVSIGVSAPEPMNITPVQYDGSGDAAGASTGVAATGFAPQKAAPRSTGAMIPVTTSGTCPACNRVPTRRPNLAAVAAVTATPVAEPSPGSCPATRWL